MSKIVINLDVIQITFKNSAKRSTNYEKRLVLTTTDMFELFSCVNESLIKSEPPKESIRSKKVQKVQVSHK